MCLSSEPKQLVRGKAFHKLIQDEWEREAEGIFSAKGISLNPTVAGGVLMFLLMTTILKVLWVLSRLRGPTGTGWRKRMSGEMCGGR